jgi:phage baseplate assembly protein W
MHWGKAVSPYAFVYRHIWAEIHVILLQTAHGQAPGRPQRYVYGVELHRLVG